MFDVFTKVVSLITKRERQRAVLVLITILVMALLEMVGIFSIMPFMAILANPGAIQKSKILMFLYNYLNFREANAFLFFLGIVALGLIVFSNFFTAFAAWLMYRFVHEVEYTLSERLLAQYLKKPYTFFLNCNTSDLAKNILSEVSLVVHGVLLPGIQAFAKIVVSLLVFALLIYMYPSLAIMTITILGGAYYGINILFKRKLERIGAERQETSAHRFRAVNEALGGVKDIKIYGKEQSFLERFSEPSRIFSRHSASYIITAQLPKYALEIIAFGGVIIITLYLLGMKRDLDYVLPFLGLYALAGYRLMPALHQIFAGVNSIRFYRKSIDILYKDIDLQWQLQLPKTSSQTTGKVLLEKELIIEDITFFYPDTSKPVIHNLSLQIEANKSIAFVGSTGSGKTTLADIVIGLLKPQQGRVVVDGKDIYSSIIRDWQRNCGYVPQYIYLLDDTVTRNIAFGVPDSEIDVRAVEKAAKIAFLHDFIVKELPNKFDTEIGERGVRLSGGQRQRLGIARALYHDPGLLIFDEATSALDGATESVIMESIHNLKGKKTLLIIAHRLSTIEACDLIYLLDEGTIVAKGSYDMLMKTNIKFQGFAQKVER